VSVLFVRLTEQTSRAGNVYLTGLLGGLRVHAFRAKNEPAVWNVFIRPERKKAATEAAAVEDSGGGE